VDALVTENMMDENGELCHQATEEATVAIGYVYSGEGCSIWYPQSLTIALPCWSYITPIHVPSSPQAESYHKMHEVSGLLMGEMLYEEYIPGTEEFYSTEGGSISL